MPSQARISAFQNATAGLAMAAGLLAPIAAHASVLISSNATTNIVCTSGVCTPSKKGAVLNASQLQTMLASGDVKVTTAGALSSDIIVQKGLSWASSHILTLDAYQSVSVNRAISVNGSGGLTILTNDGGTGGAFSFGAKGRVVFLGLSNPLTVNGSAYTLVDSVAMLASDVTANASGNYALAGDYNASGNSAYVQTPFQGHFEGLGNTISNLSGSHINTGFGLFEDIKSTSVVENVRLTGFKGIADVNAGGIAMANEGLISGSSVSGKIIAGGVNFGGLVAVNDGGTIVASSTSVTITEAGRPSNEIPSLGGLVGYNTGTIVGSSATGNLLTTLDAASAMGGLVGTDCGTLTSSFAAGSISGGNDAWTGGLVGLSCETDAISNSYAIGSVVAGKRGYVGGLVGNNSASIDSSYASGAVSGGTASSIGG